MFCASHTNDSYAVQCIAYTRIKGGGGANFVLYYFLFCPLSSDVETNADINPLLHVASCFVYSFVAMTTAPLLQGSLPFQYEEE